MKRFLKTITTLTLFVCSVPLFSAEEEIAPPTESLTTILFIGNSFTHYNNLDKTVEDMLNVSGVPTQTTRVAPGGWRFHQHFKDAVPEKWTKPGTATLLKSQKWDYVVMQEYSSDAVAEYDNFMEYGQKLAELARATSPDVHIILYETWARCDGMLDGYGDDEARRAEVIDAWTKRYSAPNDAVAERLRYGLRGGYRDLQKKIDSLLAPVGEAFAVVGDRVNLYCDEGKNTPYHPNPWGTYLAGCVFYKTITGKSPVGLFERLKEAGKEYQVEPAGAAFLEGVADEVVK